MQWIISVTGLCILFILAWGALRRPAPSYRDAPLEDELLSHLAVIAGRLPRRAGGGGAPAPASPPAYAP